MLCLSGFELYSRWVPLIIQMKFFIIFKFNEINAALRFPYNFLHLLCIIIPYFFTVTNNKNKEWKKNGYFKQTDLDYSAALKGHWWP